MAWTQEEMNEVYAKVMQKATTDEEFRQELLDDPKSAIEKLTGKNLPDDYTITVVESADPNYSDPNYTATFILPVSSAGELNLDDLDNVAGGFGDGRFYGDVQPPAEKAGGSGGGSYCHSDLAD